MNEDAHQRGSGMTTTDPYQTDWKVDEMGLSPDGGDVGGDQRLDVPFRADHRA